MSTKNTRILVVGCGGIGGVIATALASAGIEVVAVSRNVAVREAVKENGFRSRGVTGVSAGTGCVVSEIPDEPFDFVFLATQPTDVEGAARDVVARLSSRPPVVCFQNGLCEGRVSQVFGSRDGVVGAIVSWGARSAEPGVFVRTSQGGFVIGEFGACPVGSLERLSEVLGHVAPVTQTQNLNGARWSKLALNCVVSSLGTLNGSTLGGVLKSRAARRLGLEIVTEAVAVAQREGVTLEKIAGTLDLEWLALTDAERSGYTFSLLSKHLMLLAVGLKYRRLYSSMLRALEAGKVPSVDFLNGEVVAYGLTCSVDVPVNRAICTAVHAVADGEMKMGPQLIDWVRVTARTDGPTERLEG